MGFAYDAPAPNGGVRHEPLYGLLQLPPPKPEWTPSPSGTPPGNYTNAPGEMLNRLREQNPRVQDAADYYNVDPRAIALVAHVEAKYNDGLARQAGLGRGEGFGQMHHSAASALHSEWTAEQSKAARNDAAHASPLIAADLDAKARAFELVTGGQISIRNDPVVLAWAYNDSLATVTAEAETARQTRDRGQPVVLSGQRTCLAPRRFRREDGPRARVPSASVAARPSRAARAWEACARTLPRE